MAELFREVVPFSTQMKLEPFLSPHVDGKQVAVLQETESQKKPKLELDLLRLCAAHRLVQRIQLIARLRNTEASERTIYPNVRQNEKSAIFSLQAPFIFFVISHISFIPLKTVDLGKIDFTGFGQVSPKTSWCSKVQQRRNSAAPCCRKRPDLCADG